MQSIHLSPPLGQPSPEGSSLHCRGLMHFLLMPKWFKFLTVFLGFLTEKSQTFSWPSQMLIHKRLHDHYMTFLRTSDSFPRSSNPHVRSSQPEGIPKTSPKRPGRPDAPWGCSRLVTAKEAGFSVQGRLGLRPPLFCPDKRSVLRTLWAEPARFKSTVPDFTLPFWGKKCVLGDSEGSRGNIRNCVPLKSLHSKRLNCFSSELLSSHPVPSPPK